MAGLKTPPKKKRDGSKPNTALVIFLVFFILLSIGLGVWGYYGYAGQEKLEQAATKERTATKAAKDFADYVMYMRNEALVAVGAPGNPKDAVLDVDAVPFFDKVRQDFMRDAFKQEKTAEMFKKWTEAFKGDLGPFDEASKKYPTTYRELMEKYKADLKEKLTLLATTQTELKAAQDKFLTITTTQEKYWKTALADIKKGNLDSLKVALEKTKQMEESFVNIQKVNAENEELRKQAVEVEENFKRQLKRLTEANAKLSADKTDVVAGPAKVISLEQMHALMLDISRGKPLWDSPLGKITRIDLQERQVYINLGSAHGVRPDLTFNIFGSGWNARADKELKGTIEVIRVLDGNSSLARITSLYDNDGREIVLSDPTRGRPSREAENAFKEGDLLFNMFWGARVALAGNIHFAGQSSDSPAEQMRIMSSFVNFLTRQGITVDAYLDLNDGQVKGAITPRTRYLIRGDDLVDPARVVQVRKKEVKEGDGEEKKEEMKKEEVPMADALPDRFKMINEAAAKMRLEAADKGLLVISTDNFLNVVGYREPRSGFSKAIGFSPSVIFAGQPMQNPNIQAAPPRVEDKAAEEKAMEKKEVEKKEVEKKEDDKKEPEKKAPDEK